MINKSADQNPQYQVII